MRVQQLRHGEAAEAGVFGSNLQELKGMPLGELFGYARLAVQARDGGHPLAASSTLNRLELDTAEQAAQDRYKRIAADPPQFDALLVELFLYSCAEAPQEIVPDATDDPLRGGQEGRLFHGYYDCWRSNEVAATSKAPPSQLGIGQ